MQSERPTPLHGQREPVLVLGNALAVLLAGVSREAAARDHAADLALRQATGRSDIVLGRRPSGRPRLAPPYPELGVSLSHRRDLLLVGFAPDGPVGTDVECDSADLDAARLATDHFARAEATAVAALPEAAAVDLFLRLWVAKEAALKLTGRGVYDGLCQPDLSATLNAIVADRAIIALPGTGGLPSLLIAVRRMVLSGSVPLYCALAVCR